MTVHKLKKVSELYDVAYCEAEHAVCSMPLWVSYPIAICGVVWICRDCDGWMPLTHSHSIKSSWSHIPDM